MFGQRQFFQFAVFLALWGFGSAASAFEVEVRDAWVRKNLPGQLSAATFVSIRVDQSARLLVAQSPVAQSVEFHRIEAVPGGANRLVPVPVVPLREGRNHLGDRGYLIMLMNLKEGDLKAGQNVPIQLKIQSEQGEVKTLNTQARVRGLTDR